MLARRRKSRLDLGGKSFRKRHGRIGYQLGYSVGDFLVLAGPGAASSSIAEYI